MVFALTPAGLKFYYDKPSASVYGVDAQCDTVVVPTANQFDDVWWAANGHDVGGYGELLCAKVQGVDDIIVS